MKISVNGEVRSIPQAMGVDQLLEHLGYQPKAVAVAINMEFIPSTAYTNTQLHESDEVEILAPMSGG